MLSVSDESDICKRNAFYILVISSSTYSRRTKHLKIDKRLTVVGYDMKNFAHPTAPSKNSTEAFRRIMWT